MDKIMEKIALILVNWISKEENQDRMVEMFEKFLDTLIEKFNSK